MSAGGGMARRLAPVAIVLAAAVLRLCGLGDVPPGFQFDEAHNAIDAARFIDGIRPLFLPDNGGREILLTWLQAPMLLALGREHPALALRLVNALVGTLTVALVGAVVGRLFGDRRLGWLAAAFLAVMYWHLHFSRYAIRAILAPLWATGAAGAWWLATAPRPRPSGRTTAADRTAPTGPAGRSIGAPRRLAWAWNVGALRRQPSARIGPTAWSAIAGICLAAAVYSHPSGRLLPFVLGVHAAVRVIAAARRGGPMRPTAGDVALANGRALVVAGLTAFVLFVPLGAYFLHHPELFTGHASDVSLAAVAARDHGGSLARALAHNAAAIGGMLLVAGDPSTFHNLPGLTVFDPLTTLLAVCGAGVLLGLLRAGRLGPRDARTADAAALALVWLLVGLIPTLLSDRPPNYSRAIAATPIVALLPALGLRWLTASLVRAEPAPIEAGAGSSSNRHGARIGGRAASISASARTATFLAVASLAVAGSWTAWHHFVAFPEIEHVYYSYDVEKLDAFVALEGLAEDAAAGTVFLHPLWARHATIDYLNRYREPGLSGEGGGIGEGEGEGEGEAAVSVIRMLDPRDTLVKPAFPATGEGAPFGGDRHGAGAGGGDHLRAAAGESSDIEGGGTDAGAVVLAVPARHEEREAVLESAITLLPADVRPTAGLVRDALGEPLLATLSLPAALWGDMAPPTDAPLEPAVWTAVRFGGAIDLVGYTLGDARPGEALPIRLVWRAVEPLDRDLTVFVHLVGPDDQPWGQDDREPGHASFRTSAWRVGDIVVDRHRPLLDPLAAGTVTACIGWYDLADGERLRTADDRDRLCTAPLEIAAP